MTPRRPRHATFRGSVHQFKYRHSSMTVHKVSSTCFVAKGEFREFKTCEEVAQYSATFALSNGKELNMALCSQHLRNAVRIAEIQAARVYPSEKAKVTSMSFFHLALAGKRRAS